MSKEFVLITKQEFVDWADSFFGKDNYVFTQVKNGTEEVIKHDYQVHGFECHIYTTITAGQNITRDVGEDAIRIFLYDRFAARPAQKEMKILRVEGNTTVFERLADRVENINQIVRACVKQDRFCKCAQNRAHTVKRTVKSNGSTFLGCSLFPLCKDPSFNKMENAKTRYPLLDNPFAGKDYVMSNVDAETEKHIETLISSYQKPEVSNSKFTTHPVDLDKECWNTQDWPYVQYPFTRFNVVQSTLLDSEVWNKDCNLILGTATSSGKTICAELAIANILHGDK